MNQVMTFKMPDDLLEKLESRSRIEGRSKGALLREVLRRYLEEGMDFIDQITKITDTLRWGRVPRVRVDWEILRKKCQAPAGMTLEEEMHTHRGRRLL